MRRISLPNFKTLKCSHQDHLVLVRQKDKSIVTVGVLIFTSTMVLRLLVLKATAELQEYGWMEIRQIRNITHFNCSHWDPPFLHEQAIDD